MSGRNRKSTQCERFRKYYHLLGKELHIYRLRKKAGKKKEERIMQLKNVDFETYLKNYPDANGYFGKYGGAYIPEELKKAME